MLGKLLFAVVSIVGSAGAGLGVWSYYSEKYDDIANRYVQAKYQNGYLDFWGNVSEATNAVSLRAGKTHEMRSFLSSNSLSFVIGMDNLWKDLVYFCQGMRWKILEEKNLSVSELKNIGWCNNEKDGTVKPNDGMGRRSYWANLLVRTKYPEERFKFWEKPVDDRGEQASKYRDLLGMGYKGGMIDVLKEVKVKCDVFRSKFRSGKEFTEMDLKENVPLCLPSLRPLR